jgi:hypothetical protein
MRKIYTFVAAVVFALTSTLAVAGVQITTDENCCKPGAACCTSNEKAEAKADGSCCIEGAACCKPGAACCASNEKAEAKADASCCVEGAACCTPGAACCEDHKAMKSTDKDQSAIAIPASAAIASADAASCCVPGAECCVEGAACCVK